MGIDDIQDKVDHICCNKNLRELITTSTTNPCLRLWESTNCDDLNTLNNQVIKLPTLSLYIFHLHETNQRSNYPALYNEHSTVLALQQSL